MASRLGSVNIRPFLWTSLTVIVFVVLYVVMVSETSTATNSARENNLVQFIFLAVGVAASFLLVASRHALRPQMSCVLSPRAPSTPCQSGSWTRKPRGCAKRPAHVHD